mmetsp:Transcript_39372/g.82445  ORF Transcript_39372/g.82445 Transcript_39372/m.82445 type:complete len:81 (-) Transcript_39372:235-477(-)
MRTDFLRSSRSFGLLAEQCSREAQLQALLFAGGDLHPLVPVVFVLVEDFTLQLAAFVAFVADRQIRTVSRLAPELSNHKN